jgi:integrase
MASVFKRSSDRKRPGAPWYITYRDYRFKGDVGVRVTVKGCPDKAATQRQAHALETEAADRRRGLSDPRAETAAAHEARPLAEHLDAYHTYLVAKGGTEAHADMTRRRIARLVALVTGARLDDIAPLPTGLTRKAWSEAEAITARHLAAARVFDLSLSRVQSALAALKAGGSGAETVNHHVRAVKAFARWLWKDGRAREHHLAHLSTSNPEADRRRRRALTTPEAVALVTAAENGPPFRGLGGPDRAILYRVALGTGFRRDELGSLTPEAFRLDHEPPVIVCAAAYTKNGHEAEQPVPDALADVLRPWLASKAPGRPVFGRLTRTADMIRADLTAAGVEYETASGVIDFHALRASYVSNLVASGASVKTCQVLARHSSPSLTIGVYAKASVHDIAGAVAALPDLSPPPDCPEALAATGTGDTARFTTAPAQRAGDGMGRERADTGGSADATGSPPAGHNPLVLSGLGGSGRVEAGVGRAGIEPATPGFSGGRE